MKKLSNIFNSINLSFMSSLNSGGFISHNKATSKSVLDDNNTTIHGQTQEYCAAAEEKHTQKSQKRLKQRQKMEQGKNKLNISED